MEILGAVSVCVLEQAHILCMDFCRILLFAIGISKLKHILLECQDFYFSVIMAIQTKFFLLSDTMCTSTVHDRHSYAM
jgi:hypothetical protein